MGVRRSRPDLVVCTFGGSASGSYSAAFIAPGDWIITPFQDGPDGVKVSAGQGEDVSLRHHCRVRPGRHVDNRRPVAGQYRPVCTATRPWSTQVRRSIFGHNHAVGRSREHGEGTLYIDDFSPSDANVSQNSQPGISPSASDVAAFPTSTGSALLRRSLIATSKRRVSRIDRGSLGGDYVVKLAVRGAASVPSCLEPLS